MNQTWENGKKTPSFGPNFVPFDPNFGPQIFFSWILLLLDAIHCCKLSLYTTSRKTNEPNFRKLKEKKSGLILAQIWSLKSKIEKVKRRYFILIYILALTNTTSYINCMSTTKIHIEQKEHKMLKRSKKLCKLYSQIKIY